MSLDEINNKGVSPINFFKTLPQPEAYQLLLKGLNILVSVLNHLISYFYYYHHLYYCQYIFYQNRNSSELAEISICTWITSVINTQTSLHLPTTTTKTLNEGQQVTSCNELTRNGLDNSMWELLILLKTIPSENILNLISFPTFGAKFRALHELNTLSIKFQSHGDWLVPIYDRKEKFHF